MNKTSFLSSTWEIINNHYENSTQNSNKDLDVAVNLLTKLAIKNLKNEKQVESVSHLNKRLRYPTEETSEEKVKSFVNKHLYRFIELHEAGFPFAIIDKAKSKKLLECFLQNSDSIIHHLYQLSFDENELNDVLKAMPATQMEEACFELVKTYKNDLQAKITFFLLFKYYTNSSSSFPNLDEISQLKIEEILWRMIQESDPRKVVELLCSPHKLFHPLYLNIFDRDDQERFFLFSIEQLKNISLEQWPKKLDLIANLLELKEVKCRYTLARNLAESDDHKTAELGSHIVSAFEAKSLKQALPHYHFLKRTFNFNKSRFHIIFRRPFIPFQKEFSKRDLESVKRINFTDRENIFVDGSMIIGVYRGYIDVPPYLMAFDLQTEELLWGFPLCVDPQKDPFEIIEPTKMRYSDPPNYFLQLVGHHIAFNMSGNPTVHFIDTTTGDVAKSVNFPNDFNSQHEERYITSDNITYQAMQERLIGGKIEGNHWESLFECKHPPGYFCRLSSHTYKRSCDI